MKAGLFYIKQKCVFTGRVDSNNTLYFHVDKTMLPSLVEAGNAILRKILAKIPSEKEVPGLDLPEK
ncbi:MAG: hypothetical protein R3D00_29860 [Bacteroidia bacterium]